MPVNYVLDLRTVTEHFPGIGRYGLSLAQALPQFLEKGECLVLIRDPERCSSPFTFGDRVKIIDVPVSPFSISQQWLIPQILSRLRPCLYHSLYYIMPYKHGSIAILTVYDLIPLLYPESVSLRARLLFYPLFSLALSASAGLITVSRLTFDDLKAHFAIGRRKVRIIPLAASPNFHPPSLHEREAVRLKYSLPEKFILYVGSHKPHKNLRNLLKAFAQAKSHLNSVLAIAGPQGPDFQQLRALARELGVEDSVRWLGRVPDSDLPALYSASTVFVFPSLYEGFGLPVLEAMSCGAPVTCSDIPALREVAGDAALYFNPYSLESIAQAIDAILEDSELRESLVERGLRRASEFSWDEVARQTIAFYREILGG